MVKCKQDWGELKGTLRFCSTAFRLPSYNKGYTVWGSARPSPKFFFRYVPEKLRILVTLYEIASLAKSSALHQACLLYKSALIVFIYTNL